MSVLQVSFGHMQLFNCACIRVRGFHLVFYKRYSSAKELLIFWTPLVPLLGFAILAAALANLFVFDAGLRNFRVILPADEMNRGAAISRSYLRFALWSGSFFQIWYAFGTKLFGRYALLAIHIMVSGPWATHFLPVDLARRHIWTEHQTASDVQVIEMVVQFDQNSNAS